MAFLHPKPTHTSLFRRLGLLLTLLLGLTVMGRLSAQDLYVSGFDSSNLYKVTANGTVSTFASGFNVPTGVAFDTSGNLYVADYGLNTVSKVTANGTVSTFASGFQGPFGIAFDTSGNLYVANYQNGTVSMVTSNGTVSTYATVAPAASGIAFDATGNLYVANNNNNTVSKVETNGTVSTFAVGFNRPLGLAFDTSGNLYVANHYTNTVSKVASNGTVSTFATGLGGSPYYNGPTGIVFDATGNLYVGIESGKISKVDTNGVVTTFTTNVSRPYFLAFAPFSPLPDLYIGSNSSGQSTNFTSGTNSFGTIYVGYDATASNNLLTIGNTNTQLSSSADLYVGKEGASNSMVVSNGASVVNGTGYVGYGSGSSNNRVTVTGDSSGWGNDGDLNVGYYGSSNSLIISAGGYVGASNGIIGLDSDSSNNRIVVTGGSSSLGLTGKLSVGQYGSSNTLVVSNQGSVLVGDDLMIALDTVSSNNSVVVSDAGSSLTVTNGKSLNVGWSGSRNTLVISNGASANAATVSVGVSSNSVSNSITVGGGSGTSTLNVTGDLNIGYSGTGNRVTILAGGAVSANSTKIGGDTNANGNSMVLSGGALTNSGDFRIGYDGASNSLVIGSGTVSVGTNGTATDVGLDASSSNNSVLVAGSNSLLRVGSSSRFALGYQGSGNSMVVSNGGRVAVTNSDAALGFDTASSNNSLTITGAGSVFSNSLAKTFYVGRVGGSNTISVLGGGTLVTGALRLGASNSSSNNLVLVSGAGSVWTNNGTIRVGSAGGYNSLLVTNGGIVRTAGDLFVGYDATSSNNNILVDGSGSQLSSSSGMAIGVQGAGSLTVANGGTVTSEDGIALGALSGSTGTLNIGRFGTNDTAGVLNVTALGFGGGAGSINFNQRNGFVLTNDLSGYGSINQAGSGTTILSGSNSYTGTTLVTGGTLVPATTNGFGTSAVVLTGGKLSLPVGLTVSSLIWDSAATIALPAAGSAHYLTSTTSVTLTGSGTNTFDLTGVTLGGSPIELFSFGSNRLSTNQFNITGISDYVLSISNNALWISVSSLIAQTNNTIITNTATYPTVTFLTNGILTITPSADLSITAPIDVTNNATVVLNGVLNTPSVTVASGGTLSGTGTLNGNLTNSGVVAPGNSPGTLTVKGNFAQTSGGTLLVQVGNGLNSMLSVNGTATLGGTLVVNSYAGHQFQYGEKIVFLSASEITGSFSSVVVPDGFRGRVKIFGDPMLEVIMAPASYTQMAQNRNQSNVASALNSFIPATSGDRLVVSTTLDSLTAPQYNQAFNAIMPSFYQQVATIAFNQANAQNMELSQRLWGLRVAEGGGFSMSGLADNYAMIQEGQGDGDGKGTKNPAKDILRPGLDNRWGMFVDGNGIFAQANSANMLPGYNSQSGGVTTGLTYKWNKNVSSGIYCGYQGTYTKSGANGSGLGTGSSLTDNAVRFGVFGTYGQENGKGFYANALAGGAYHNLQATRVIQFPGLNRTANSAPGAGELDTMLGGGYDVQKGNFTFGPTASLQYTYLGVNGLNETGAQSLNFNSSGWNSSSMLSSLGAHAAYTWYAHKNIVVVPQISLNWQHEFMQNPYAISGNLGGVSPTFSNWSASPIRDYLYTGVGFTVEFAKRWNTSFFYNAVAGNQNLTSQNIFWSAGLKF